MAILNKKFNFVEDVAFIRKGLSFPATNGRFGRMEFTVAEHLNKTEEM